MTGCGQKINPMIELCHSLIISNSISNNGIRSGVVLVLLCVCLHISVCSAFRGQKSALILMVLQLHDAVRHLLWVLATEIRSYTRVIQCS